ncbi:MAG: hypothetical protein BWK79_17515 [Beggiatoa sp. IS2]|nr:MAG: hypothetical protein BWK79_17515 [Beggiatoa sp. IS2]
MTPESKINIQRQRGFVLALTLWMLAILTIAAGFFSLWTQRAVTAAQTLQMDLQGEIDMQATQANLIYLMATQRFNIGGLTTPDKKSEEDSKSKTKILSTPNDFGEASILPEGGEIFLDDRPYFGSGKAYFALQDESGLVNINLESMEAMSRLLNLLGIKKDLCPALVAKLRDYTDEDDLHLLNGAEKYEYNLLGLSPPSNRLLIVPWEARRILDWDKQPALWENDTLPQLTQALVAAHPNINTAPAIILQAVYNLTDEATERVIKAREGLPFYEVSAVTQIAGMTLDIDPEEADNFFPASYLRLMLWYENARRMRQIHLQITPYADKSKPWMVHYTLNYGLLPRYTQLSPIRARTTLFDATVSSETP